MSKPAAKASRKPRAAAPRRGTRVFLAQVADELPSHLPPRLRDFSSERWGRMYKVWFAQKKVHFEVQFVHGGRLEIGLHLEADQDTNERVWTALERKAAAIRRALGDEAAFGSHGPGWRCVAEKWSGGDLRGEEAATEAASRLAEYVVALAPLLPKETTAG
jgi:hypothetical protein